ncbi:MAG: hypothetical protein R3Y68_05700 [Rikenellaceae bacterium]
MKRLTSLFAVLISLFSSSCQDIEVDQNALNYQYVYYGIVLHANASQANTYAMDGVNVAVRLGILLDEVAKAGYELADGTDTFKSYTTQDDEGYDVEVTPTWSDLPKYEDKYELRQVLIGDPNYTTITRDGDSYTIAYKRGTSGYSGGFYDANYRWGSYVVDTKGVLLSASDSSVAWKISSVDDLYLGSQSSLVYKTICTNSWAALYHNGDGCIMFSHSATFDSGDANYDEGTWDVYDEASITFAEYDDAEEYFSLSNIAENNIEYRFLGGGETMYGETMDYETTTPLIYNYSETPYGPVSGAVKATAQGDTTNYEVNVSFNFTDGYLYNDTYLYNGYTYLDSYYYSY